MAPQNYGQAITHTTEHFAEYYQQMEKSLNVLELTQRVYRRDSEYLLGLVKRF